MLDLKRDDDSLFDRNRGGGSSETAVPRKDKAGAPGNAIIKLQKTIGNRAVASLIRGGKLDKRFKPLDVGKQVLEEDGKEKEGSEDTREMQRQEEHQEDWDDVKEETGSEGDELSEDQEKELELFYRNSNEILEDYRQVIDEDNKLEPARMEMQRRLEKRTGVINAIDPAAISINSVRKLFKKPVEEMKNMIPKSLEKGRWRKHLKIDGVSFNIPDMLAAALTKGRVPPEIINPLAAFVGNTLSSADAESLKKTGGEKGHDAFFASVISSISSAVSSVTMIFGGAFKSLKTFSSTRDMFKQFEQAGISRDVVKAVSTSSEDLAAAAGTERLLAEMPGRIRKAEAVRLQGEALKAKSAGVSSVLPLLASIEEAGVWLRDRKESLKAQADILSGAAGIDSKAAEAKRDEALQGAAKLSNVMTALRSGTKVRFFQMVKEKRNETSRSKKKPHKEKEK